MYSTTMTPPGYFALTIQYCIVLVWVERRQPRAVTAAGPATPASTRGCSRSLTGSCPSLVTRPCPSPPWPRRPAPPARPCTGAGRTRPAWPLTRSRPQRTPGPRSPPRIRWPTWAPNWPISSGASPAPGGCLWSAPCCKTAPRPRRARATRRRSSPPGGAASARSSSGPSGWGSSTPTPTWRWRSPWAPDPGTPVPSPAMTRPPTGLPVPPPWCGGQPVGSPHPKPRSGRAALCRPGSGVPGRSARGWRLRRGLGGQELDWAGVGDLTVQHEEIGEPVVVVIKCVSAVTSAGGCFRDQLRGEAAGGVAEQQVVRRVGGPGPAADDVDIRIVVAVGIANRERRSAFEREDGFLWGESPVSELEALGKRALGKGEKVGAAVVIHVGECRVGGVHRGAEDRGHIREAVALPVFEQVQPAGLPADQKVLPAVAVVIDGVRAFRADVEIEPRRRGVDKRALPGVEVEPVDRRQAVGAQRLRAVEDVRVAVMVRVQDGAVPAAARRVGHVPLVGLIGERVVRLLDVQRI